LKKSSVATISELGNTFKPEANTKIVLIVGFLFPLSIRLIYVRSKPQIWANSSCENLNLKKTYISLGKIELINKLIPYPEYQKILNSGKRVLEQHENTKSYTIIFPIIKYMYSMNCILSNKKSF